MSAVPFRNLGIGKLAGTTDLTPLPHRPADKWNERGRRLLDRMVNPGTVTVVRPYLEAAEELLVACVATVRASTGQECDPITAVTLSGACRQHAYACYWADTSDPSTAEGQKTLLLASKFFDSSRNNMLASYANAVTIARSRPTNHVDPLDLIESGELPDLERVK